MINEILLRETRIITKKSIIFLIKIKGDPLVQYNQLILLPNMVLI